jgi:hypothetical protein
MLTRAYHARDWRTGFELSSHLLGAMSRLEVHHIFPKALLYKHGYERADVNALANFTFLTKETNLYVSDRDPSEYLKEFAATQPGVIESHWLPMDEDLWKVENYTDFLTTRRELLAKAANDFLDSLLAGNVPQSEVATSILDHQVVIGNIESEEEERILRECNAWIVQNGLPEGELMYELTDAETGKPLAILDLAWTNGLQEGYSQPVALLLDESLEIEEVVNKSGYLFFTNADEFKEYVQKEILAMEPASSS